MHAFTNSGLDIIDANSTVSQREDPFFGFVEYVPAFVYSLSLVLLLHLIKVNEILASCTAASFVLFFAIIALDKQQMASAVDTVHMVVTRFTAEMTA